ncbi:MAG: hypothetical protein K8R25_03425 [Methanosarcinales archaeon]|nr:hypothetical protein [Methanosarcinales archaeon]
MKLKSKLIEFMVVHDFIPARVRWRKSASGVGRMFNDVFHMLDKNERVKLTKMMYSWGLADSDEIVKTLGIERNLHGCAIALMGMHRLFGIKSHIADENANEIKIHATECMWKNKRSWTSEVCVSIDHYERGIVDGINKNLKHYYTTRRSKGDKFCELILKKS